jgi:molybdopterin molybdotransferase
MADALNYSTELESMRPRMSVSESWSCFDAWLLSTPDAVPGGLNAPATEDELLILEGALGVKLPDDFRASLQTHDGQADQRGRCFFEETPLDIKGILREWTTWRDLVVEGAFEGVASDPDTGVKDNWYNLKWIPFTKDGIGDCLCLDLDPAPGGTYGQVIRVLHDDDRRERVAASYEQWLQWMVMERTGFEPHAAE